MCQVILNKLISKSEKQLIYFISGDKLQIQSEQVHPLPFRVPKPYLGNFFGKIQVHHCHLLMPKDGPFDLHLDVRLCQSGTNPVQQHCYLHNRKPINGSGKVILASTSGLAHRCRRSIKDGYIGQSSTIIFIIFMVVFMFHFRTTK